MMMGNERYTSPALSRDLAEAFADRDSRDFSSSGAWWRWRGGPPCLHTSTVSRPRCYENDGEADLDAVRALDLTDCLAEIEKRGATWLVETDGDTYCATAVLNPTFSAVMGGPTAVEAAGLCLLALMDKLREVKP